MRHEYGNRITAIYINYNTKKVDISNRKVIDWILYGKIDGEVKVEPNTPEFFGLTKKDTERLGLIKTETSKMTIQKKKNRKAG